MLSLVSEMVPSCEVHRMLGEMTSGYFTIDPDETGLLNPFLVWCDFSTIPATTKIHHNRYDVNLFVLIQCLAEVYTPMFYFTIRSHGKGVKQKLSCRFTYFDFSLKYNTVLSFVICIKIFFKRHLN